MEAEGHGTKAEVDKASEQKANLMEDLGLNCLKLDVNAGAWFVNRSKTELDTCLSQISSDISGIVESNPNINMDRIRGRQKAKKIVRGGFTKGFVLEEDNDGNEHPDLPKLVRDKIPDILKRKNIPHKVRVANYQEMPVLLAKKIREEYSELSKADDDHGIMEEITDLLEAVDQLKDEERKSPIGYGQGTGISGFWNFMLRAGRRYKLGEIHV